MCVLVLLSISLPLYQTRSTLICRDDLGLDRQEGESWEQECNDCSCNLGQISCTRRICPETSPPPRSLCECINPFSGINSYIGDSSVTCNRGKDSFCYVSCNADCRDRKPARGEGRC